MIICFSTNCKCCSSGSSQQSEWSSAWSSSFHSSSTSTTNEATRVIWWAIPQLSIIFGIQCLVRRTLAWLLFFIVAVYVVVLGVAVFWAWIDGGAAARHFHTHFEAAEKEEVYITELEEAFDCESDDDREVENEPVSMFCGGFLWFRCDLARSTDWLTPLLSFSAGGSRMPDWCSCCFVMIPSELSYPLSLFIFVFQMCWERVNKTFVSDTWLDILFIVYIVGHILAFLAIPFFNKRKKSCGN